MGRKYTYQDPPLAVIMVKQANGEYEEVSSAFPFPMSGGAGGGSGSGNAYAPLTPEVGKVVGSGQVQLTPPVGAIKATVRVMTGTIHRMIGAAVTTANTKLYSDDYEILYGAAEIAAYRMTRGDGIDATVDVEYGGPA